MHVTERMPREASKNPGEDCLIKSLKQAAMMAPHKRPQPAAHLKVRCAVTSRAPDHRLSFASAVQRCFAPP